MISLDDIAGIVLEQCRAAGRPESVERRLERMRAERHGKWGGLAQKPYNPSYTSFAAKRIFLTEYEIKRLLGDGSKKLVLPRKAIVSPLAQDWLAEKGVEIVYE